MLALSATSVAAVSNVSPVSAAEVSPPPVASSFIQDMTLKNAAESKEWQRLMHYISGIGSGVESRIDGPGYFFAADGKTNPEAELRASITAFLTGSPTDIGKQKLAPQCAFPYRYRWVKARFKLPVADIKCPELDDFVSKFKAKSVSLVFSTAYPNNPGSMFGHTFFKFNSGVRSELLDQAISYAANIGQDAGFLYMARGVFGGYIGAFSLTPYYVKVNEYNHSESRDLWEYELSLTEAEVHSLILHFWDIEANTWFQYYFFDENCALILMTALEAVKPEWTLADFHLYTIPSETVKHLQRYPESIRDIRFRPSLRKKYIQAQAALNPVERAQLLEIREGRFAEKIGAPVLDVASIYFQYVKQRDGKSVSPDVIQWHRETLLRRSQLKDAKGIETYPLPPLDQNNRPDLGHHPKRLLVGAGFAADVDGKKAQPFYDLGFRFAYHDLLNFDDGYERYSHFEFPGGVLRYYGRDQKLTVESITAVSVISLFPWNELEQRLSWKFALDYRSPKDFGCGSCHALRMDVAGGVTVAPITDRWLVSLLGGIGPEVGSSIQSTFRLAPKTELSTIGNLTRRLKGRLASTVMADVFQGYRSLINLEHRAALAWSITQNTELRGEGTWIPPTRSMPAGYHESRLALHLFF